MTGPAGALVLLAAAVLLSRGPALATARMRTLSTDPADDSSSYRLVVAKLPGQVVTTALCAGSALAAAAHVGYAAAPVLPALAGMLAGGAVGSLRSRTVGERQRHARTAALVESVGALAADLRAGQHPGEARAALATGAAAAAPIAYRPVAAVWVVSERSGAPAAAVLDRVEQDLRSRQRQQREVAAQLAGARSTAALLAGLPILGLGLGSAMGARPVEVLLGTPTGQVALTVGAGLEALGILWTSRIVARAEGPR